MTLTYWIWRSNCGEPMSYSISHQDWSLYRVLQTLKHLQNLLEGDSPTEILKSSSLLFREFVYFESRAGYNAQLHTCDLLFNTILYASWIPIIFLIPGPVLRHLSRDSYTLTLLMRSSCLVSLPVPLSWRRSHTQASSATLLSPFIAAEYQPI